MLPWHRPNALTLLLGQENLEAYLRILGKKTPQFAHEIAEKTLVVGLGSTKFRTAVRS